MARRNKTSRKNWDEGFRVEVTVHPNSDEDTATQVSKSEDEKTLSEDAQNVNIFGVRKSINEELREITCVAMVANELDAHGELFTVEAVKGASEEFLVEYNISKSIGLDHSGERPDVDLVGNWYAEQAGEVDGFKYPAHSWIVKMKVHDDDVWESVKSGERTGVSIQGAATGFAVVSEDED